MGKKGYLPALHAPNAPIIPSSGFSKLAATEIFFFCKNFRYRSPLASRTSAAMLPVGGNSISKFPIGQMFRCDERKVVGQ